MKIEYRFLMWIRSFVEIIDSLIVIFSFTMIRPGFGMSFFGWEIKRGLTLRKKLLKKI
jgi:hypothetical protein